MDYWIYSILFVGGILNLVGSFLVVLDKKKAGKNIWRIPEKRFYLLAALGAWPGLYLTMHQVRHKTQKWSFRWRLHLCSAAHVVSLVFLLYQFF
jgi:uncharacterized membrane protein YsdA (DUF1294 family)